LYATVAVTLDIFFFVYVLASPTTGVGGGGAEGASTPPKVLIW